MTMADAPSTPAPEAPATPAQSAAASAGVTVISSDSLPLYKNPKKGTGGWVDVALDVISRMRAKSPDWNHGKANSDIISEVIERRNAGSRRLGAHELEHLKVACEDAQKFLGLSEQQNINPLAEIAKLFGQLTPSERAAVVSALG
jgi:hypothetical protein